MMIVAEVHAAAGPSVLAAVAALPGVASAKLFAEAPPPAPAGAPDPAMSTLADQIATLLTPKANQPMRREALEAALGGYDSFWDQKGELDASMRNALGSISKALRPIFKHEASPIDRLATRVKHYEPGTRRYLGTRYRTTPLGALVRSRLKASGAIS